MADEALVINLEADPQDALNYLSWVQSRYPMLINPDPIQAAKFVNSHNTVAAALLVAVGVGNAGNYLLANLIIAGICTNPVSSAITANGATLACDAIVGATGYNFQYRKMGSNVWISVPQVGASATPQTVLAGLAVSTTYQWQVQGVYPSGVSKWTTALTFTTPAS